MEVPYSTSLHTAFCTTNLSESNQARSRRDKEQKKYEQDPYRNQIETKKRKLFAQTPCSWLRNLAPQQPNTVFTFRFCAYTQSTWHRQTASHARVAPLSSPLNSFCPPFVTFIIYLPNMGVGSSPAFSSPFTSNTPAK